MREKVNREQYVGMGGGGHQRDCTIYSAVVSHEKTAVVATSQSVAVSSSQ
jgi:hypothetical protein